MFPKKAKIFDHYIEGHQKINEFIHFQTELFNYFLDFLKVFQSKQIINFSEEKQKFLDICFQFHKCFSQKPILFNKSNVY